MVLAFGNIVKLARILMLFNEISGDHKRVKMQFKRFKQKKLIRLFHYHICCYVSFEIRNFNHSLTFELFYEKVIDDFNIILAMGTLPEPLRNQPGPACPEKPGTKKNII